MGGGGAACPQTPKFELPIAQEGMVYKIWDSVYKIVQNEYKIMIQFFMLKLHLGGRMSPGLSQILIADSTRGNGVQNFGIGVDNCTKLVQNYDPAFYVETAFGGGASCPQPLKFELPIAQEGMVYKIVQNYDPVFYVETAFGWAACHQPPSQILIADSAIGNGVQHFVLGVQNCTK